MMKPLLIQLNPETEQDFQSSIRLRPKTWTFVKQDEPLKSENVIAQNPLILRRSS